MISECCKACSFVSLLVVMQGRQKSKPRKQRSHSLHQRTPAVKVYQVPWSHEALQTNSWKSHVSPAGELLGKHANSFNHICITNSSRIWWLGLVLIKTTRVSVMCLKTGSHLLFVRRKKKERKKEKKHWRRHLFSGGYSSPYHNSTFSSAEVLPLIWKLCLSAAG